MGFRKADDFYVALGQAKISARVVVNKLMQRLKQGEAAVEEQPGEGLVRGKEERARPDGIGLALRHPGRRASTT